MGKWLIIWLIILLAGMLILGWSIARDIRYSREYPVDLRNRVVGARLVSDGRLPYFYKWKKADGVRYYDPRNFDSLVVSNITASPFHLHLLSPVAGLPQETLIWGWLVSEYVLLAAMAVFCFSLAATPGQKQWVLVFFLLFLLTNAWKRHVYTGQSYLWIPFLAMLLFAGLRRTGQWAWGLAAGAAAACLVLIRPNAVFLLLPFLFLVRRYKRSWLMAFCLPPLLLAGWTALDARERNLWKDYREMLGESFKLHQSLGPALRQNEPDPQFSYWEGVDKPAADRLDDAERDHAYSENGNVFVVYRLLFKRSLSPLLLTAAGLVCMAALLLWFYVRHRPFRELSLEQATIFAFCLYMVNDLFSPYYRHQYYTVQWFFPLLLAAATWGSGQRKALWLLAACLLLGGIHLSFLRMQNTIAEYGIFLVLLVTALGLGLRATQNPRPVSLPK